MKTIKLQEITLTNFKGIRNLNIEFNEEQTVIKGRNGSGKTTIFDAFYWVLFGKNSDDKKQFSIKTLDASGEPIHKLTHEVTAVLRVDDELITLTRSYKEKWSKKRGQAEEEFTGHEEARIYNGVPMSVKEWQAKIDGIINEETFKFITNPFAFISLKPDAQREMLIRMAGDVDEQEIINSDEDFKQLFKDLSGKSLEEYKKEIASLKKHAKQEIEHIPARIDELQRMMPEEQNWMALSINKRELQDEIARQEGKQESAQRVMNARKAESDKVMVEMGAVNRKQLVIKARIQAELMEGPLKAMKANMELKSKIDSLAQKVNHYSSAVHSMEMFVEKLTNDKAILLKEYKEIKQRTFEINEDDFVCQLCGRPFDVEDIQAKKVEMMERFRNGQAKDLADNVAKGKALNVKIAEYQEQQKTAEIERDKYQAELDALKAVKPQAEHQPSEVEIDAVVKSDPEYIELEKEIERLQFKLASWQDEGVVNYHEGERAEDIQGLRNQLAEVEKSLYSKEVIESSKARIEQLASDLRKRNEELARLERTEFVIQKFSKTRIESVENKINSMFTLVSWRMFTKQINGGEQPCCEALIGGVPYVDANSASKINAGLDIINAISESVGCLAPIFIDNAESVLKIHEVKAQRVLLQVDNCALSIE